jgi:hypothetical protein
MFGWYWRRSWLGPATGNQGNKQTETRYSMQHNQNSTDFKGSEGDGRLKKLRNRLSAYVIMLR